MTLSNVDRKVSLDLSTTLEYEIVNMFLPRCRWTTIRVMVIFETFQAGTAPFLALKTTDKAFWLSWNIRKQGMHITVWKGGGVVAQLLSQCETHTESGQSEGLERIWYHLSPRGKEKVIVSIMDLGKKTKGLLNSIRKLNK